MKISIITVVFNNAEHLEDCISSVQSQKYKNIEYIIVDGGSTDGTLDIIKKHEHKISRWVSERDNGIYDAMNKGISMATGDVIGFLHSDDFYADEDTIEKVAKTFIDSATESAYGDLVYVSKNGSRVIRYWKSGEYKEGLINRGWMPPHPTFFVRKNVYEKYGNFNTQLKIAADYELILRFLKKEKISTHYIPNVLVKMKTGGKSNKVNNLLKKSMEDYKALRMNGFTLAFLPLLLKNLSKIPQFFHMG